MRFLPACLLALTVAGGVAGAVWEANRRLAARPPGEGYELETRGAATLLAEKPFVFPSRINEAVLRWSLAEQVESAPALALLGSSHGLQVSSDDLGRGTLLNFSMSGGMLSDHLVTSEILVRRNKAPKVWLVMTDPWFFNPDTDFQNWYARPEEMARIEQALSDLGPTPLNPLFRRRVEYYLQTKHRPTYSVDPLLHLFDRMVRKGFDNVVVPDHDFQATLMLPDGSLQPASDKKQITSDEVRAVALRQFASNRDGHRYGTYSKVDDGLWKLFERWVQYLQKDGGRVIFILSPYHPAIYSNILKQPQNHLSEIEPRLRELARQNHIAVVGSYDPVKAGVEESDFYDGDHLREQGIQRLFGRVAAEIPVTR